MANIDKTLPALALLPVLLLAACAASDGGGPTTAAASKTADETSRMSMVADQIEARGIRNPAVLDAMRSVPRHAFVPEDLRDQAYRDTPLPIGHRQTISQPYIVALMTALIEPDRAMRVLEIGTGSGYQAAVLAECVESVYTIEILPELGRQAAQLLEELGYDNIHARIGDGYDGWPDEAPYDGIIVTAAPSTIPQPLLDQLAIGGRLVIPVDSDFHQNLLVVTRTEDGYERRIETAVRFVPMTGKAQEEQ